VDPGEDPNCFPRAGDLPAGRGFQEGGRSNTATNVK